MSITYSGDKTATQAPAPIPAAGAVPVGTLPSDGDGLNAASVRQAFKACLDYIAWLTFHGAWADLSTSVSAVWTFTKNAIMNGDSGDTNAAITTTASPTARKLLWSMTAGAVTARLYYSNGGFEIAINALWGGSTWTQQNAAAQSIALRVEASSWYVYRKDVAASAWNDSSWDATLFEQTAMTGDVSVYGQLKSLADVFVTTFLQIHLARSSATVGSGQSVSSGRVYKDGTIVAWAVVPNDGVTANMHSIAGFRGYNIASCVRNGVGSYTVTVQSGVANKLCPIAVGYDAGFVTCTIDTAAPPSTSAFKVLTFDPAGNAVEVAGGFFVIVTGG